MIQKISIKWLILSVIVVFALLTLVIAVLTSDIYKKQAFKANSKVSSRFIEVTVNTEIENLRKTISELGREMETDKQIKKLFKSSLKANSASPDLINKLDEPFFRMYQSAGLVNILKIRIFDKKLNFIGQSKQGDSFNKVLESSLKGILEKRKGADRFKQFSYFWNDNGEVYYSMIFPIGGLSLKGYGEIILEPSHNLKNIAKPLASPITIKTPNGSQLFQSKEWPNDMSSFVSAGYHLKNQANESTLSFYAAINSQALIDEMLDTRNLILLTFIISAIIFIVVSLWFLGKALFSPLSNMVELVNKVADGELTQQVKLHGVKEIFNLGEVFNAFVNRLSKSINVIDENANVLLMASSTLFNSNMVSKDALDKQQFETEQVATSMNEMTATVAEVACNTSEAAQSAQESLVKSSKGKESVEKVVSTIEDLATNISSSESLINQLSKETQEIRSILDVISGISDQTNLLALNAAIEAARAGESGRGFAVVADEVRSLANLTAESANDIRTKVEALQSGASNAVQGMSSSRIEADRAVNEIKSAGTSIVEVSTSLQSMNDVNTQIATAAEEQTAVANEININVTQIKDLGNDNVKIVHDATSKAKDMLKVAENLKQSVSYFRLPPRDMNIRLSDVQNN